MKLKINVIVAYSNKYIIGYNNDIPWSYKEDLKYFQKITSLTKNNLKKNIVIMGYNTYVSLNSKKLKDRINIVITTKELDNENDLYFVDSLGKSMEESKKIFERNEVDKIFIIGGASIYEYFFKSYYYTFLDKIYITRIHKDFEGNKFFYGLEEKFYYLSVKKSDIHPEIEYRVLQYEENFYNAEKKYLDCVKYILCDNNVIYDDQLKKKIVFSNDNNIELDINLQQYFPLFSFMKEEKDNIIQMLLSIFNNIELKEKINEIINLLNSGEKNNSLLCIDMINVAPFNSIYYFNYENNNLSCNVEHIKGNILTEIIYNIMFTSLMVIFIAKITNFQHYMINYKCKKSYYIETDNYIIDKIAWNVPDVLPLLKLADKDYKNIDDYCLDDLIFLGLFI